MEQEKHQYCFSFMRDDTGGQKTKTFWADGNEEESLAKARQMAENYRYDYEHDLNEKACQKSINRGDRFKPSKIRVQIVGRSMWK